MSEQHPSASAASGSSASGSSASTPGQSTFRGWMGSMWLYTLLRFGMFFVLWGIAYLIGFHSLLGPLIALVVSVPLSLVLLSKPRQRFTEQFELRMQARQLERQRFDADLDPGNGPSDVA